MKITDSENIKNIFPQDKQKVTKKGDQAFDDILNQKIGNLSLSESESKKTNLVNSVSDVYLKPGIDKGEMVPRVDGFLDMMEEYAGKLNRPEIVLREISPLIEQIENESQDLKLLCDYLPPNDEIKALIEEVLIRSSVEVIKFNRGDYLNA